MKSKTKTKSGRTGRGKRKSAWSPLQAFYVPASKKAPRKRPAPPPPLLKSKALHPGDVLLQNFLAPNKMTQAEMTEKLGWKLTRLNKLINGKGGVTALSAMDIARVTGTKPEYWLGLQLEYDLERAKESHRWDRRKR
jgi:antitoxin HigA-1